MYGVLSNSKVRLGLLEFGDIDQSYDYHGLLDYVKRADALGYSRIWFGEHYSSNLAFTNPEPLLPALAVATERIRLGIGGMLLKYHAPYRIASHYKLLANMFLDRIDLGLCKTSLPNNFARILMGCGSNEYNEEFDLKLDELQMYLDDRGVIVVDGAVKIPPFQSHALPSLWMLNSSFEEINKYPNRGLNFCRCLFHSSGRLRPAEIDILRNRRGSGNAVAIALFCSEDRGRNITFENDLRSRPGVVHKNLLCATPQEARDYIIELKEEAEFDEVILLNLGRTYTEKCMIIELLQNQFKNEIV
ncbi:LLM class flavin-dependent oxidoreductase [Dyadobacter jiangsuensis]|uniref:Alkanesulfonate monooxygenase SsuD/methylene tetrahydromethanopterin reductase-like flavin-dependent oxidoreductase (Luciferase family) n=1 Tax=Dyadobacter jiangsuensis TaxID=1591085 RepID=A0A2P8FIJ4_9BACT|nr:LLM class flavin-dependent oxidoreductase [Dyadobacter jiangsuensis]PSL21514.1 alkanesulfonate monooxygenase SsuD/methylene tetrahydromethanopterin reductase-like flavin-dependent oxidoreductase (luciferase family) [Dyadobacter jiangsuensis]